MTTKMPMMITIAALLCVMTLLRKAIMTIMTKVVLKSDVRYAKNNKNKTTTKNNNNKQKTQITSR